MKKVSKTKIKLEKLEPELVSNSNVSLLVAEKFSRSIKVRLYLNEDQKYICENSFGIDRFVFNRALALKKNRWEEFQENLHWTEISKMFTLMKKSEEYGF